MYKVGGLLWKWGKHVTVFFAFVFFHFKELLVANNTGCKRALSLQKYGTGATKLSDQIIDDPWHAIYG